MTRLVIDKSSLVQSISESRGGGPLSVSHIGAAAAAAAGVEQDGTSPIYYRIYEGCFYNTGLKLDSRVYWKLGVGLNIRK